MTAAEARAFLLAAWAEEHGAAQPTTPELQGVQSVCLLEGAYGTAYGACRNWGSVHAGKPSSAGECPEGTLKWVDYDAKGQPYDTCMRCYKDDVAAARHMVNLLTTKRPQTWAALRANKSLFDVAAAMRRERYFEAPAAVYGKGLERCAAGIAKALKEPLFGAGAGASSPGASSSGSGWGWAALAAGGIVLAMRGARR